MKTQLQTIARRTKQQPSYCLTYQQIKKEGRKNKKQFLAKWKEFLKIKNRRDAAELKTQRAKQTK